jgi:apolipoprotein N-acyltransferase
MGVQIRFFDSNRLMENRLIIIDPTGKIVINHLKYGATSIDNIAQGEGILQMVDTPYGTLSGIICYDADFPMTVNQVGRNGADILFLPNGDPNVAVTQLHAQQAIFRSIENGVSLVRQDGRRGWSIATDPYGRILAAVDNLKTSERVMVAQVPTHRVFTLYSIIGDYFAWLSVAGFVGIMVLAIVSGRKRTSASPNV